jgi:hypothetical protein
MQLLEVWLSPQEGNTLQVIISHSPAGEARSNSLLPFRSEDRDWRNTIVKVLECQKRFNPDYFTQAGEIDWMKGAGLLDEEGQNFHPSYVKKIGQILYDSIFPPNSKVRQTLQTSLRFAEQDHGHLHICLKFESQSFQQCCIADYPWELIHDGQDFLLHHGVSLSRYIASQAVPPALTGQEKIHILLISSQASDAGLGLKPLTQQEQSAIREGISQAEKNGLIKLTRLALPTQRDLRNYLSSLSSSDSIPHVLHFDGHGIFGKRCVNQECRTMHKGIKTERCSKCKQKLPEAEGYLVFEDGKGGPDYVRASSIGRLLRTTAISETDYHHEICLVVLSACQSGMALNGDSVFNGVAQSLISHQVPAVVAMQYSVRADAACRFAEQFYRALSRKNSLSIALTHGRDAMLEGNGNQWFRPVLYLRWRDNEGGQIFKDSVIATDSEQISSRRLDLTEERPRENGKKIALLIGVSEYGKGFTSLPGTITDVEAVKEVLQSEHLGGFDEVKLLTNPNAERMREGIKTLFSERCQDDLILLFFSGHGIKTFSNQLFFGTAETHKSVAGDLEESSAVSADFVHNIMDECPSQQQVVILDCCFSGAFPRNLVPKDDASIDIRRQLGGVGRAIMASSTELQNSVAMEGKELSLYTFHLVEGICTGQADLDKDNRISIHDLHEYVKSKVQEVMPEMKPALYAEHQGEDIHLTQTLDAIKLSSLKIPQKWRNRKRVFSRTLFSSKFIAVLKTVSVTLLVLTATSSTAGIFYLRNYCTNLNKAARYTVEERKDPQKQQAHKDAIEKLYSGYYTSHIRACRFVGINLHL